MTNLIIGTAGHIDHGKSELIKALTGVDTDRLKDEKDRGISIDLGFARFPLKEKDILLGVVDVPGHEAFIRNMLAGVTGVDLVLFVIAADEGVMPQTTEHLDILRFLEVKQGVLVITKADLVEEDWIELVVDDAKKLMKGTFMENAPVIVTSTKNGRGLDELREKLLEVARKIEARPADDLFRLPIDRVFTIRGIGTVITGTIWSGTVELDQALTIHPVGKVARVKSIQVHSEGQKKASAGTRVALAVGGISREEIQRGSTALLMTDWDSSMMIEAHLSYLPRGAKTLKNRTRVRFHLATQEVMGRVILLEGRELSGGESGYVQIRLEKPIVTRRGDHFVIRSYSPLTTIGGGTVLIPYARKRTTVDSWELRHLKTLHAAKMEEIVESLVRDRGAQGYPVKLLPVDSGISPKLIHESTGEIYRSGEIVDLKGKLFHRTVFDDMCGRVIKGLELYHKQNPLQEGVKREELKHRIKGLFSDDLLDGALSRLIDEGRVKMSGGGVKLSSHKIVFSDGMDALADEILTLLSGDPLSPPDLGKMTSELGEERGRVLELLNALQRTDRVVKVDENIWLVTEGIQRAREMVEEHLKAKGKATASEIRELLNISRKYAIPILEHLDRIGVTYRKGDFRYLKGS